MTKRKSQRGPVQGWKHLLNAIATFVFGSVGVVALVLQLFTLPKSPKLEVGTLNDIELYSVLNGYKLPLKVSWDASLGLNDKEIPLSKLRYTDVIIRNSGEGPLDWADAIKGPLRIKVLDGRLLHVEAQPIKGQASTVPHRIEVQPGWDCFTFSCEFLNAGDAVWVSVFHTGGAGSLQLEGRAKGMGSLAMVRFVIPPAFFSQPAIMSVILQGEVLLVALCLILAGWRTRVLTEPVRRSIARSVLTALSCVVPTAVLVLLSLWVTGADIGRPLPWANVTHVLASLAMLYVLLRYYMDAGAAILRSLVADASRANRFAEGRAVGEVEATESVRP